MYAVELHEKGVWTTDKADDWEESECEDFYFEGIDDNASDNDAE